MPDRDLLSQLRLLADEHGAAGSDLLRRARAVVQSLGTDVDIADNPALASRAEGGTWVMAWIWVADASVLEGDDDE